MVYGFVFWEFDFFFGWVWLGFLDSSEVFRLEFGKEGGCLMLFYLVEERVCRSVVGVFGFFGAMGGGILNFKG